MGFRDVLFFLITAGTNLQWVATAAAGGASAITVWFIGFFGDGAAPRASASSRSRPATRRRAASTCGRRSPSATSPGSSRAGRYWMSNLPYFPAVLYFAAGNALYAGGSRWTGLLGDAPYFIAASLDRPRLRRRSSTSSASRSASGSRTPARSPAGSRRRCSSSLGVAAYLKFGSATHFSAKTLLPTAHLKDIIFWSTIAFALTGLESASFMGYEIRDARRTVPRAILVSLPIILVAVPRRDDQRARGAAGRGGHGLAGDHAGDPADGGADRSAGGLSPGSGPDHVTALGSVGAWLASVARIPFVAGIDHYLPEAFGRVHAKWGTPWVALLSQALITGVFVFLGQAGTSVRGAYDALVSMTIIWYFIPFLYLFAAADQAARRGEGPGIPHPGRERGRRDPRRRRPLDDVSRPSSSRSSRPRTTPTSSSPW